MNTTNTTIVVKLPEQLTLKDYQKLLVSIDELVKIVHQEYDKNNRNAPVNSLESLDGFKVGDRVYHKKVKRYGTIVRLAYTNGRSAYVDWDNWHKSCQALIKNLEHA